MDDQKTGQTNSDTNHGADNKPTGSSHVPAANAHKSTGNNQGENSQTPSVTGQKSAPKKESKLDQWIRQTLQLGSPKAETKIIHQATKGSLANNAPRSGAPQASEASPSHQSEPVGEHPERSGGRSTRSEAEATHPHSHSAPRPTHSAAHPAHPARTTTHHPANPAHAANSTHPSHSAHTTPPATPGSTGPQNRQITKLQIPASRRPRPKKQPKGFFFGKSKGLKGTPPARAAHSSSVHAQATKGSLATNASPNGRAPEATKGSPSQQKFREAGQPEAQRRPPPHPPRRGLFQAFSRAPQTQHLSQAQPKGQPEIRHYQTAPQHYQGILRAILIGGLDEVGKNCMALEYIRPGAKPDESEIILIDLGFQFPDEDMLGVDYIIPDVSYLEDKLDRIRGIVFTHGHLDHIGGVPYLMPKLNFPALYGTKLTMGLIEKRLEEFGQLNQAKINVVTAQDVLQLGPFNISFFAVNHSIPDAVGVVVKTPAGNIVHTGDFKFDHTPSGNQKPADFPRIAGLASQDIAALFIDSTNALKPGHTVTEKRIGESLETIIKNTEGRILIASFSSQIGRIQQIIDAAKKHGRTIFLSGRSLVDNVFMASKLGYLNIPQGLVHDIYKVKKIPEHKALILTTGSQGEDVSALTRMALEEHQSVKIRKGDTVVLSSSPIPGNERAITTVTNNLSRLGAKIINNQIMDVHASGHAQQEDLKLMMSLVRPKYVVPVHGEYFMRYGNKEIAMSLGYDEKHSVLVENGDILEIENNEVSYKGEKVSNNYILVDGLGVGDIGAQVIMDRQTLAENGVLIVLIPVDAKSQKLKGEIDIISRGFIYMSESEELIKAIKEIATTSYRNIVEKRANLKRTEVKKYLRESIDKFVHQKIERHPLVIPIVTEV